MTGRIIKIEEDITSIITPDNQLIEVKTPFLPLNLTTGSEVEIQDEKIVIR